MSLVIVKRLAVAGKAKSSPELGRMPPLQFCGMDQLPSKLPFQVLVVACVMGAHHKADATMPMR